MNERNQETIFRILSGFHSVKRETQEYNIPIPYAGDAC